MMVTLVLVSVWSTIATAIGIDIFLHRARKHRLGNWWAARGESSA